MIKTIKQDKYWTVIKYELPYGRMTVSYITKECADREFPDTLSYMRKVLGWNIPHTDDSRALFDSMLVYTGGINHRSDNPEKSINNIIERYSKKMRDFLDYHVDKPMVEWAEVYDRHKGQGKDLYLAVAKDLLPLKLTSSEIQSQSASDFWKRIDGEGLSDRHADGRKFIKEDIDRVWMNPTPEFLSQKFNQTIRGRVYDDRLVFRAILDEDGNVYFMDSHYGSHHNLVNHIRKGGAKWDLLSAIMVYSDGTISNLKYYDPQSPRCEALEPYRKALQRVLAEGRKKRKKPKKKYIYGWYGFYGPGAGVESDGGGDGGGD